MNLLFFLFRQCHCIKSVNLERSLHGSLGFSIVGGCDSGLGLVPIFVKAVVPGTPAATEGKLRYRSIWNYYKLSKWPIYILLVVRCFFFSIEKAPLPWECNENARNLFVVYPFWFLVDVYIYLKSNFKSINNSIFVLMKTTILQLNTFY